jgi:hypothetical protein
MFLIFDQNLGQSVRFYGIEGVVPVTDGKENDDCID